MVVLPRPHEPVGRRSNHWLIGALLPVVIVGVLALDGTAEAAPPNITCGTTITASVTLSKNLSCPAGNGLVLGRDVTLDLGGHRLIGPGTASGIGVTMSVDGYSAVVNGGVKDWQVGIQGDYVIDNAEIRLADLTLRNAAAGFPNGNSVTMNNVTAMNSPVFAESSLDVFDSNFTSSNIEGFMAFIEVRNSSFVGSGVSSVSSGSISVDRSTFDGRGYAGNLGICGETGFEITNSTVKNYTQGIRGYWCGVTLTNNKFSNMSNGVLTPVTSPFDDPNPSAVVTNNTFTSSGVVLQSGAMVVKDNKFSRNATGIVFDQPQWSTASGNTFTNNTDSGIRTDQAGLTVGNNTAINNGAYGIYAPDANNLGGNIARGNTLANCVGLVCALKS